MQKVTGFEVPNGRTITADINEFHITVDVPRILITMLLFSFVNGQS